MKTGGKVWAAVVVGAGVVRVGGAGDHLQLSPKPNRKCLNTFPGEATQRDHGLDQSSRCLHFNFNLFFFLGFFFGGVRGGGGIL